MLVLLYYFSQNADFAESVKPLMAKLKNSEQMLRFLKDLSNFTQTFSSMQNKQAATQESAGAQKGGEEKMDYEKEKRENNKKTPQSPTEGIADEFIQSILESYLKNH